MRTDPPAVPRRRRPALWCLPVLAAACAAADVTAPAPTPGGPGGPPAPTAPPPTPPTPPAPAPPAPAPPAPAPPAPAPGAAPAPDGIYLGLRTNFDGRVYQDYWTFFPDGRVVDADPDEGLGRPVDLARLCRRHACGTYARRGGELRIRWAEGADERVYDVDADGAFNERGRTQKYRPLAPLDGLRLDATFAVQAPESDTTLVRLRLTADGRFAEQGLMHYTAWAQLGAPGEGRVERPGGAGRYAVTRNTLALAYDGGQAAYFTVVVPPGEAGKPVPDVLYVNQARLPRVP
jgi:hypothetical protein